MTDYLASLYQFLIEDFDFILVKEVYDPVNFGNRYATLKSSQLIIRYVLDRSQLRIEFAGINESSSFFSSELVIALIENVDTSIPNSYSVDQTNEYIRSNFEKIQAIFSKESIAHTHNQLENIANERFYRYFK